MTTRKRSATALLPKGFKPLEPWVADWVLEDSRARYEKRLTTPPATIRAFYDALLPHAPAALALLGQRQLGALNEAEGRLLKLLLSLAEMGPAVEWYGTGEFPDSFDGRRFRLIEQLPDNQPQGAAA